MLFTMGSCSEDLMTPDVPVSDDENLEDVYALNFMVTLDNMGSGISTRADYDPSRDPERIRYAENYIDLERFRVLFFDENNMFMFESKNRWIKRVDSNDNFSSWYVSVPLGAFGNDSYGEGKEYDWDDIHNKLTSNRFKIAILANRPYELQYPGFTESTLELPDGVFKNDGPVWTPADAGKKSLLDLHHCQYDIIYTDKGNHLGKDSKFSALSFYDFVMGDINTDRPTMGASIHWASFDYNDTDKELLYDSGSSQTYMRNVKMPSEDHPIPMYGIQIFEPIPSASWKKGTPFDISNEPADAFPDMDYVPQTISLLRSCVRIDLKIPKSVKSGKRPTLVTLWYSNIYSRCEPIDTWTPTDKIWKPHNSGCEWELIRDYGLITDSRYSLGTSTKDDYQKRLSWFYGAWTDPALGDDYKWKFNRISGNPMTPSYAGTAKPLDQYPHIFNPCIQRNKVLKLDYADVSDYYNDGYWHYVVYTGERNMNDPNNIYDMAKNPYIATFVLTWDKKSFYCVPLMQYDKNKSTALANVFGPFTDSSTTPIMYSKGSWPGQMDTYVNSLPSVTDKNLWPYPLLRNHIYTFTLKGTKADGDVEDLTVVSDVVRTDDINFSERVKHFNMTGIAPGFKVDSNGHLKLR